MPTDYEPVWEAMRTLLATNLGTAAHTVSRRLKGWASTPIKSCPAVYQVELMEETERHPEEPPRQVLHGFLIALVVPDSGTEVATSPALNAFMAKIKAAMKPGQVNGRQTLGGLVYDARLTGSNKISEGDIDGSRTYATMDFVIVLQDDVEGSTRPFVFSTGFLFATPVTQQAGVVAGELTPIRVGALRDVAVTGINTVNMQGVGQFTFPTQGAQAQARIRGKAAAALIDGKAIAQLWYGAAKLSAGATLLVADEPHTVPGSPYTVTIAPPNSGTWSADLGVLNQTTGKPMTLVTGVPTTGQYAVAAGVYTFASADVAVIASISYLYTTASGSTLAFANPMAGPSPTFRIVLQGEYNGRQVCRVFNACTCTGFTFGTTVEQFAMTDFSFEAMGDPNNVGTFSVL
jgi:hypothetical protein